MDTTPRIRMVDLPRNFHILRYSLENGVVSLWVELDGKERLLITKDKDIYRKLDHPEREYVAIFAWGYTGHFSFVWGRPGDRVEISSNSDSSAEDDDDDDDIQYMTRDRTKREESLIEAIEKEMDRLWDGTDNFEGTFEQYDWLLKYYGITEEEDVQWMDVQRGGADIDPEEGTEGTVIQFLEDAQAVEAFLTDFLDKYRNSNATYAV